MAMKLTKIHHQCKIYTSILMKPLDNRKVSINKDFRKKGFFERIVTRNFKLRPKLETRMAKTLTPTLDKKRTKAEASRPLGNDQKLVSITEAAEISNVTRQAIYVAIKLRKLQAKKENTRWAIHVDDLEDYRLHRYSRTRSMFDGELLFDNIKGYYSVNQIADKLKVPAQKIYYATRAGHIRGSRKGAAWVIHDDELKRYKEAYLDKKFKKKVS